MRIARSATSVSWIPSDLGGEDQDPVVAPPETELERALAEQLSELAQGHHREGSSAGR